MATTQYAIGNVAKNKQAVVKTAGTSDGSNAVRVIIDDTLTLSCNDAMLAIDVIKQRLNEDTWPITAP